MDTNKLRELLGAATPGPWEVCTEPPNRYWNAGTTIGVADPQDGRRVCDVQDWGLANGLDGGMTAANAALIVALRNNAESLLARLEAAERVVEAARLFKEWCDKEKAGPQWSSELRREGPNGEAEWRKWWNDQLWLADQGPAQVEAALSAYDQAKE